MRSIHALFFSTLLFASLAVSPAFGATYHLSPGGNDANSGTQAQPWRTLQKAAATLSPGDTALIADGEYPGGINIRRAGQAGFPLTFRAINPGGPVIRGDQTTDTDAIWIQGTHDVVIDGLTVTKANRAAIRVDNSNRVTLRRNRCVNNAKWGIFTNYSDDTVIEYNECAWSALEHGIYASNSGDRPIIRYNVCHDNARAGIQVNADAKLINPLFGTRGDGITDAAVVEGNTIYNCGTDGAAGINFASVRNSRVANNLLYNCVAGGIALWDDGAGFDYGSKNNLIVNNTIYFRPGQGRRAISFQNGSTGNTVLNNIFYTGQWGAYEIDAYSSFTADYNVYFQSGGDELIRYDDFAYSHSFEEWRTATGNDAHSYWTDPWFANATAAPFDFRVVTTSPAIRGGIARTDVPLDIAGNERPRSGQNYIGCYEAAVPISAPTAPEDLSILPTNHRLELNWSASARATGYLIRRGPSMAGPFEKVGTSFAPTFTDLSLENGRTYWYVVSALNIAGESLNSKAASGVPEDIPVYAFYMQVTPKWVVGSHMAEAIIKVSDPAPEGGLTFYLSSNNTKLATVPASVTIPEGAQSVTFPVQTYVVQSRQGATLTAALTAYKKKIASFTVLPPNLSGVTLNTSTAVGGATLIGTVELDGPAPPKGRVITLVCDPELSVPVRVKVLGGTTSANFNVPTKKVTRSTPSVIVARDGINYKGVVVTLTPWQVEDLTVEPGSVLGGELATGTVTLNAPAPLGGAVVTLKSSNTAAASVLAKVTVPRGAISATFTVTSKKVTTALATTITGGGKSAVLHVVK